MIVSTRPALASTALALLLATTACVQAQVKTFEFFFLETWVEEDENVQACLPILSSALERIGLTEEDGGEIKIAVDFGFEFTMPYMLTGLEGYANLLGNELHDEITDDYGNSTIGIFYGGSTNYFSPSVPIVEPEDLADKTLIDLGEDYTIAAAMGQIASNYESASFLMEDIKNNLSKPLDEVEGINTVAKYALPDEIVVAATFSSASEFHPDWRRYVSLSMSAVYNYRVSLALSDDQELLDILRQAMRGALIECGRHPFQEEQELIRGFVAEGASVVTPNRKAFIEAFRDAHARTTQQEQDDMTGAFIYGYLDEILNVTD